MLVKLEVYNDGEYCCARGIGEDIFTQGKTLDELMDNIREAVEVHFTSSLINGHYKGKTNQYGEFLISNH